MREPARLVKSLAGADPQPVDPEREVVAHVGQAAPLLVDLEEHDAILVDRAFCFPVHACPPLLAGEGRVIAQASKRGDSQTGVGSIRTEDTSPCRGVVGYSLHNTECRSHYIEPRHSCDNSDSRPCYFLRLVYYSFATTRMWQRKGVLLTLTTGLEAGFSVNRVTLPVR
jgi:hypothetical protein